MSQCGQVDVGGDDEKEIHLSINRLKHDTNENAHLNLREAQRENRDILIVKDWLEKGEKPKSQSVARESWFVKSLLNQLELFEIQNILLARRWKALGTDKVIWQAIVPLSLRRKVLKYSHD